MSRTADESLPLSPSATEGAIKSQGSTLVRGPFQYDAYIGHTWPDSILAEKICKRLDEVAKITTCPRYVRAEKDLNVLASIKNGVLGSQKCVVLITDDYLKEEWSEGKQKICLKDGWDEIEIQEVLNKATRFSTDMILVVALNNVKTIPDKLRQFKLMRCDGNILSGEWINSLALEIKKDPKAELTVMPKENIGYGAATGFFYGFLTLVLPGFRKRCLAAMKEAFPHAKDRMVTKMLVIMPTSCFGAPTLKSPGQIEVTNKFVVANANRAGNVARDYKSSIYKFIVFEDDAPVEPQPEGEQSTVEHPMNQKKDYYFVGELATPLLTMYELYINGLVGMTKDQLDLERNVFFYTLQQVLHHPNVKGVHDQFQLLWWNDEDTADGKKKMPLYDFLLPFILEEAKKEKEECGSPLGAGSLSSSSAQVALLADGPSHIGVKLGGEDSQLSLHVDPSPHASIAENNSENEVAASTKTKTYELLEQSGSTPAALYDRMEFGEYDMDKAMRGKCLIINIYKFHSDSPAVMQNKLQPRKGAERDTDMMRKLFESLKFEVEIFENINFKGFEEILLTYSTSVDHTDYNAFVCVIMTHGRLGEVFTCDGIPYRILDIADFFSGRYCKSLLGKPKLFFIQACQGGSNGHDQQPANGNKQQSSNLGGDTMNDQHTDNGEGGECAAPLQVEDDCNESNQIDPDIDDPEISKTNNNLNLEDSPDPKTEAVSAEPVENLANDAVPEKPAEQTDEQRLECGSDSQDLSCAVVNGISQDHQGDLYVTEKRSMNTGSIGSSTQMSNSDSATTAGDSLAASIKSIKATEAEAVKLLVIDSEGERYGPDPNAARNPELLGSRVSKPPVEVFSSGYSSGSGSGTSTPAVPPNSLSSHSGNSSLNIISHGIESPKLPVNRSESKPSLHQSASSSGVESVSTSTNPPPHGMQSVSTSTDPPPQEIPVERRACLVPGDPDFLMSYSTLPGSISYRDTKFGSLYIQALANNLSKGYEIDRALKFVTQEVAVELQKKREADKQQYQFQLPFHLTTGMTKVIFLKP